MSRDTASLNTKLILFSHMLCTLTLFALFPRLYKVYMEKVYTIQFTLSLYIDVLNAFYMSLCYLFYCFILLTTNTLRISI